MLVRRLGKGKEVYGGSTKTQEEQEYKAETRPVLGYHLVFLYIYIVTLVMI